jgi:uncharacterized protein (TIGR04255 family)
MPLFDLPAPPAYTMSNAPLAQALAQVRYPLIAGFESMHGIAPLQRELIAKFPYMQQERVQELSLVAGPAGPSANAAESVNWHFTDDAGSLIVVGAGSATLSVGDSYTGVDDFAESFTLLLEALATVGVARCDRLGVRYLSISTDPPTEPRSWRKWFKPELIGWQVVNVINEQTSLLSVSQTQLSCITDGVPTPVQGAVRHGAVPPGTGIPGVPPITVEAHSYFLDLDVFTEGPQSFAPKLLVEQFSLFHGEIDRFFYWSLTEMGGEHFGISIDTD